MRDKNNNFMHKSKLSLSRLASKELYNHLDNLKKKLTPKQATYSNLKVQQECICYKTSIRTN